MYGVPLSSPITKKVRRFDEHSYSKHSHPNVWLVPVSAAFVLRTWGLGHGKTPMTCSSAEAGNEFPNMVFMNMPLFP